MYVTLTQPQPRYSIGAAIALFFIAPLLAEYLLGDLPITMLAVLIPLAPLYGGGALLIREVVRRTGRGWPSILVLGAAYGLLEEAFLTQTLFNPDIMHRNMHLLDPGYISALGIGAWWTLFVLTLHTAWSIGASIALAEGLVPSRATTPWLGNVGLAIVALLFTAGVAANALIGYRMEHFLASRGQFAVSGIVLVALIAAAFLLSHVKPAAAAGGIPNPWLAGLFALVAGSAVLMVPMNWGWGAAASVLALDLFAVVVVLAWSRRAGWMLSHKFALGAGAALAYAWRSFVKPPLMHVPIPVARTGNAVFSLAAVVVIIMAAQRISHAAPESD